MSIPPSSQVTDLGELRARAQRTRLVLSDVDGVLTDGCVYYSERGEELKRFSLRDGMGVERLRAAGIETGFVTRERTGFTRARADKLGVTRVYAGVRDKGAHLAAILADARVTVAELAFIGDDVNDLDLLRSVGERGLTAAPADAIAEVRGVAHHRCAAPGGAGAFRDFAEWILSLRRGGDLPAGPPETPR